MVNSKTAKEKDIRLEVVCPDCNNSFKISVGISDEINKAISSTQSSCEEKIKDLKQQLEVSFEEGGKIIDKIYDLQQENTELKEKLKTILTDLKRARLNKNWFDVDLALKRFEK